MREANLPEPLVHHHVVVESRSGRHFENEDRYFAADCPPFYAVLDGEVHRGRAADVALGVLSSRLPSLAATLLLDPERVRSLLSAIVREANEAIFADTMTPGWRGCGTTLTCFTLTDDLLVFAHVGDSRLYIRTSSSWHLVTSDHSLVQDTRRAGSSETELSELIANHSNVITRALGFTDNVAVDTGALPRAAVLEALLCSDGLWRPFDPGLTGTPPPPQLSGKDLLDWAFRTYEGDGQRDNATGLLVAL
jgi:protein phosphatase